MHKYFLTELLFSFALIFSVPIFAHAQTEIAPHSYHYSAIEEKYVVNKNSTIDVSETQTFNYIGQFHRGRRWIPEDSLRYIDNVSVSDGNTGTPLVFSPTILNKDDPKSWGKYTYYVENKTLRIEWYFDLRDTTHRFTLHYRLHGAVNFYDKYDGLYRDLVTSYEVPIDLVTATIVLPEPTPAENLFGVLYGSVIPPFAAEKAQVSVGTISFSHKNIAPRERITIATGGPSERYYS